MPLTSLGDRLARFPASPPDTALLLPARAALGNTSNSVFVDAAWAWETTNFDIGKMPGAAAIAAGQTRLISARGLVPLRVCLAHGQAAEALPGPHKCPFDRILVGQAMLDGMGLVQNKLRFDSYGVRSPWLDRRRRQPALSASRAATALR
jgi:PIN domain nuclease of toxin-antitoxin system